MFPQMSESLKSERIELSHLVTSAWGTRISKQTISGSVVALWFRWVSDFDKEEEWVNYIKIYFRFFFSFLKPGLKVFQ